jgi:hypothetical protein
MTGDAATWGFVGVIVGGLITGLLTLGVELIRANKAASLDSAKRRDDRQLGRDQFQRETLLELQRAVTEFMTALGRLHSIRTSDAVADASRAALLVGTLGSRVDDDLVRMATDQLLTTSAGVLRGEPADAAFDGATTIAVAANSRAGEIIRATFVDLSSRSSMLSYPPKGTNP